MKTSLVLIGILTLASPSMAQDTDGFSEGTITRSDGSVLTGLVEFSPEYGAEVAFKAAQTAEVQLIDAETIRSMDMKHQYVENIDIGRKYVLMPRTVDGTLQVFAHRKKKYGAVWKDFGDKMPNYVLELDMCAIKKGGTYHIITPRNFREAVVKLISDEKALVQRVNNRSAKFEDIELLITEYNDLNAPPRVVTAQVVDSQTGAPVADARITVQGSGSVVSSNALGFFQITVDTAKRLIVDSPGYGKVEVDIPAVSNFRVALTPIQSNN